MADRGRDLKFSILSDLSRFDTDKPAKGLEDLGDAAEQAGRMVDRLEDNLRQSRGLDNLKRDARETAGKVDDAFDKIAKASRTAARKVDDEMHDAGKALDEFKDEAHSSGREAAASFGGGFDDIGDFIQETAANAFGGFGPLGAAAGIAAAAGIGVITAAFGASKEKAEEARAAISEWVDAFIDGQGKISQATVDAKIATFLEDGATKLHEYADAAERAGISVSTYIRAQAGDVKAIEEVKAQIIDQQKALAANTDAVDGAAAAHADQAVQLQNVARELGITTGQINEGKDAYTIYKQTLESGVTAPVKTEIPSPARLAGQARTMRNALGQTIPVPVAVTGGYAAAVAEHNRIQQFFYRNPVKMPINPQPGKGQGYGVVRNVP